MGDNNSASNGNLDVVLNVNDDATKKCEDLTNQDCVPLLQKVI
jgi:aquaporin NIP